jgi:hypothetical protein
VSAEREALRGVGRVMQDHEPRWNQGKCRCGAPLGDRIDWDWHLANQATLAAFALLPTITDEAVDAATDEWFDRVLDGAADTLRATMRLHYRGRMRRTLEAARLKP